MKLKEKLLLVIMLTASIVLTHRHVMGEQKTRGVTDNSIKIGVIMDQTGPAASTLVPLTNAIKNYTRYINEQGGVNGRQLKILVEDDRYSIPPAIAALKKLVYRDRIFALIGPGSASLLNVLWKGMEKAKLPTMAAPSTEIAIKPFKKYLFIFTDTYKGQMINLVDYMVKDYKLKEPRIGLIYPDTEAGKTDLRAALPRLKQYNLTPVTKEILMPGSIDAMSQVMKLRRYKVNYVLNIGTIPPTSVTLLRELRKFGLNIPVFNSYGAMLGEELTRIGDAAEQAYVVHAISPWYGDGPGVADMRETTLKYHPGTEKPHRGTAYTGGWAVEGVLVEGLKRAGKDLTENSLIRGLESLKNFDNGGLTSTISYSSTNHKGGDSARIFKVDSKQGKYVALTGWRKSE